MIEIWSKPQCPFCDAAVQICVTKELEFQKYMLDVDFNREEFTEKFPNARGRINCTMAAKKGRWRWFGKQFVTQ